MKKGRGRPPLLAKTITARLTKEYLSATEANLPLPSERKLATLYGVSRSTIRSILQNLEQNRILVRKRGRASRVAEVSSLQTLKRAGNQIGCSFNNSGFLLTEPFRNEVMQGLMGVLVRMGLDVLWVTCDWRYWRREQPVVHLGLPTVRGVALYGRHSESVLESFKTLQKPFIALDCDYTSEGIDSFCLANRHAGELLARRLFSLGHRKVMGIFESPKKPLTDQDEAWSDRREGFVDQWKKLSGDSPLEYQLHKRDVYDEANQALYRALRSSAAKRPTALCIPNAGLLPGVREVVGSLGLRIPRHLSVVGFRCQSEPSELTSIRFDGTALGHAAGCHLERLLKRGLKRRKAVLKLIKGTYSAGVTHARANN